MGYSTINANNPVSLTVGTNDSPPSEQNPGNASVELHEKITHEVNNITSTMLSRLRHELDYRMDLGHLIKVSHIEHPDEAHFWLNGYANKQNCRIWREGNPQVYVETPLHPEKLTVWCALWAGGILLQKR
ncbi:uncharacterized protein TNCV_2146051 [Trichonephila clavipes]|uniref:Uncharacterized protein n=1 Tax=Trichonephila clavipes TaxID=2585209 RepID=A0A8X6VIG5_TRICX|nr:uncharacterized protein TNCV_2146051 [Trichonephila clavipes]